MEEIENDCNSPQLKGVVIITLPPPDNPSLGKTITAFTLSNDDQYTSQPPPPPPSSSGVQQPRAQNPQGHRFPLSRLFANYNPRPIFAILGVSLIGAALLYWWTSFSEETLFELRDINNRKRGNESSTFVFPLYPKLQAGYLGSNAVKLAKSMSAVSSKTDTAATVIPVRGYIYPDGLYYTYMRVGNPPSPYFFDIDTGSDLTWIQCDAPCTSCAKGAHPFYKPKKGNIIPSRDSYCIEVQTNQNSKHCESCHQCDYEIEYADHSSSVGVLARDELHLKMANGSLSKSKFVFGCAYHQQGLLLDSMAKTDGILGLSRSKLSLSSQLASQGIIKDVVGHCLSTVANGGSYMFFGDDFVPYRRITWLPMLQSPVVNSYETELRKLSYGGKQLSLGGAENGVGSVVFDSGTSYSYFTGQAYNDLVNMLNDISSKSLVRDTSDSTLPICWRADFHIRSVRDVKQFFKPLNLEFRRKWWIISTKLQIPPEGYLITNDKGNICLGILDGSKVTDDSTILLGDISLRGQLFVYDNVNQKIGWLKSNCAVPEGFESSLH